MKSLNLKSRITPECTLNTETHPVKHLLLLFIAVHQLLLVHGNYVAPESVSSSSSQHLLASQGHSVSKTMTHATAWTLMSLTSLVATTFNFWPTADTHSNNHILGLVIYGNCATFETAISSIHLSKLLYFQHTYFSNPVGHFLFLIETFILWTHTHFCSDLIDAWSQKRHTNC